MAPWCATDGESTSLHSKPPLTAHGSTWKIGRFRISGIFAWHRIVQGRAGGLLCHVVLTSYL